MLKCTSYGWCKGIKSGNIWNLSPILWLVKNKIVITLIIMGNNKVGYIKAIGRQCSEKIHLNI